MLVLLYFVMYSLFRCRWLNLHEKKGFDKVKGVSWPSQFLVLPVITALWCSRAVGSGGWVI